MSKVIYKSDPDMLTVLDELDYLVARLKRLSSSSQLENASSVDLNHIIERIERLRTQIACMSSNDLDWVGILQAIVCIAQYLTKLCE